MKPHRDKYRNILKGSIFIFLFSFPAMIELVSYNWT